MQSKQYELKGQPLLEVNPIQRGANCKLITLTNQKQYLVGGMTAEAVSNQVYQLRLNHQHQPAKLQWRQVHFDNDLFSPRNSFAACGVQNRILVWGGLEVGVEGQKCLSDLIEIDPEFGKMRLIPLSEQICIHSASLHYDSASKQLIAYGGTDEMSNMSAYLYSLKLEGQGPFSWEKANLPCKEHEGHVWQHSGAHSKRSFFSQQEGDFLTVVGGCRYAHSPYKAVIEIDLNKKAVTNSTLLESGLVSHDCVEKNGRLYIFGGANGGDFSNFIYVLHQGKVHKLKGHRAIGCCCCTLEDGMLVYGGVCGANSINGAFYYK